MKRSVTSCAMKIPLKKTTEFQLINDGGRTSKEALSNLKPSQPLPTGQKNYQYFISVWQQGNMSTFKDFCTGITLKTLQR